MSDVLLKRLRSLRAQADKLLKHAPALSAFLNKDELTFLRTPESLQIDDDVNVTTTCSCLMALAVTDQVSAVYKGENEDAAKAFMKVIRAPWMSSGLTENNAFTTTLIIRTLGFLLERDIVDPAISGQADLKKWEVSFGIKSERLEDLVVMLKAAGSPASEFIWRSFSDRAQHDINNWITLVPRDNQSSRALSRLVALELQRVVEGSWIYDKERFPSVSVGTQQLLDNATTAYKRAAANRALLAETFPDIFELRPRSLADIATQMSSHVNNFIINEYSPSAAVLYWFVDGVTRSDITLPSKNWSSLCRWATDEFNRQRSLVDAQHDAMMDPVAMSMAACLCARLRCDASSFGAAKSDLQKLPSSVELEHSIKELFKKQTNGIWPKYFPLFHYQEAGSNFCFAFELLEAVLVEFGGTESKLLDSDLVIKGLSDAVAWCETNKIAGKGERGEYIAWNSGGSLDSLKKRQPESWATAVVHMFLWELVSVLSQHIQRKILNVYQTVMPRKKILLPTANGTKPKEALDEFLDIGLLIEDQPTSLREIFKAFIDDKIGLTEVDVRRRKAGNPLSALLFGPPGTSKTEVTKAIAHDLGWPLVQINPSDFLKGTLANVYAGADEIFQDLSDLAAVVVFFDEMDALTQSRSGGAQLDTATQFLTTSMLPKLADLHHKGRALFFMATNFQNKFDPALKRAGRFDLLLCMGPPLLEEKLARLHTFYGLKKDNDQTQRARARLEGFLEGDEYLRDQLTLYTFGEFKSLLNSIGTVETIGEKLETIDLEPFAARVKEYTKYVTLRLNDLKTVRKLRKISVKDLDSISPKTLKPVLESEIARYILDRRESRRQY
jgi:hypothetical protein